ncbi:hypothetical protein ACFWPH_05480 [Nocardia sp. NPDC058499]|uniref:hypothetical protein n=1 Tax=Nocardia sp. NPDC058499 TaxID=3346530 RepID=UPI003663848B
MTILAVTACQSDSDAATADPIWFEVATTDEQHWELMRRIREVDPCALLPRSALEEHGTVREVRSGSAMIAGCRATVDGESAPLELTWTLAWAPGGSEVDEDRRVGDVSVEILDPSGESSANEVNACWVTAQFPSMTQILLSVKGPPAVDTCAIGDELIESPIAQLPASPPYGTSPDSARSVLTGADPCEILPEIGATPALPAAENQVVHLCRVEPVPALTIGYEYQVETEIMQDEIVILDGRQVFAFGFGDGEQIGYTFVVGPPVAGDAVPTVTVLGGDHSAVERARDALMKKYPAP